MSAPFSPSIMDVPLPRDFRLPAIKPYMGTTDPRVHMTRYKAAMVMIGAGDAVMCRAFLSTLDGAAQDCNIQCKKPFSHPCVVKQDSGESLKDFLNKWKKEVNNVYDFDSTAAIPIFIYALRSGYFYKQLNANQPRSYEDLMRTANRYAEAKEVDRKKKDEEDGQQQQHRQPMNKNMWRKEEGHEPSPSDTKRGYEQIMEEGDKEQEVEPVQRKKHVIR
ncbi:PREDICTED: uncharacterized protein LOC109193846 [Ipomoea nil]|uniref:uncharacterized protein LOC109193846 n=1 Tax=Ipomoea nil TaxID=35883 RepID=UPI000901E066|nr:PREDICTED: uncharacterized protein LOC109193846 [Ipomoea nil]